MKRALPFLLILLLILGGGLYFLNQYWIHRYDALIQRQANIYHLDPDLVWSIIYEETYFRSDQLGKDGEIGLMQVTPAVGRDWAAETGMRELGRQMATDPQSVLSDPERNIQVGCWYLEKIYGSFRDLPEPEVRVISAYNAGPSRAAEWNRTAPGASPLSGDDFVKRIDFPSTRAYVTSIMDRYRKLKQARGASK